MDSTWCLADFADITGFWLVFDGFTGTSKWTGIYFMFNGFWWIRINIWIVFHGNPWVLINFDRCWWFFSASATQLSNYADIDTATQNLEIYRSILLRRSDQLFQSSKTLIWPLLRQFQAARWNHQGNAEAVCSGGVLCIRLPPGRILLYIVNPSAGMCEDRIPWVTLVAPRTAHSGFEFRVSRPPLAVSQLLPSWTLHTLEGVTSVSAVSKVLQPMVLNQQQKSRVWPPTNQQWQRTGMYDWSRKWDMFLPKTNILQKT